MTRQEWLKNQSKNEEVTFIIAKAVKDEGSTMYHHEYRTTPIRTVSEWLKGDDGYVVINTDHPPIDITGSWEKFYRSGRLKCVVITTKEDLYKLYGREQGETMLKYYEETCRNQ